MSERNNYKVIFKGEIADEMVIEQVKENLARLFKSSEVTIDKLFSGKAMTIKKNMSEKQALSYQQAITKSGAITHIINMDPDAIETIEVTELPQADHSTQMTDDTLSAPPPVYNHNTEEAYDAPPAVSNEQDEEYAAPPAAAIKT